MENYLDVSDTLSPGAGNAFITINGQNRVMFETQNLKAQLDQAVSERGVLGNKMTQHKRGRLTGTGSCTMYFMNSEMLNAAIGYMTTGKHVPITIQGYNEDAQSTIGRQEVILYNVIFKTIPVLMLDDSSDDPITFDSDFTFDRVTPISSFVKPENYR
jgi:hypothetical protein